MRGELFVTEEGSGSKTPVVLSHALGLDHGMWRELAADLSAARPVLRYDHRGHGASAKRPLPGTLGILVADAIRVIEAWDRGPVVFVGLSLGGMVAQGVAISRPNLVKGLVLANTLAAYPESAKVAWAQRATLVEKQGMQAVIDMVVQRYLHDEFRAACPDIERWLRELVLKCDTECYAASCRAIAEVDWLQQLSQIRCPTLVLAGALDQGATPKMAAEIRDSIPHARLEVFAGASHLSVIETPQAFLRAVQSHLAICDAL